MKLYYRVVIALLSLVAYSNYATGSWFGLGKQKQEQSFTPMATNTDLMRSLFGNLVSTDTHFPRIFRTPSSYNAIFDLPGFHPQDLHVSLDEDTIHVEGHSWCPKTSEQSTSWLGEKFVGSERDLCIERHVNSHVTLPRNMKEHGSVRALFENGVLRVAVPVHKEEQRGYARKLVDVLTGNNYEQEHAFGNMPVDRSATGAMRNAYENVKRSAEDTGERIREGASQAQDAAVRGAEYVGDTARYVREKGEQYGEEYIKRPAQRAGANMAERVRETSQHVADRAEDVKQRVKPSVRDEFTDQSKGIYARASDAIHNAADTVMHPFRKSAESNIRDAGKRAGEFMEDHTGMHSDRYGGQRKVPIREGRVVNDF